MAEMLERFHQNSELSFRFASPDVYFRGWALPSLSLTHLPFPSFGSWDKPRGEMGSCVWMNMGFGGLGGHFWGKHPELRETWVQVLPPPCMKCVIVTQLSHNSSGLSWPQL